jgi:hypothetical protein
MSHVFQTHLMRPTQRFFIYAVGRGSLAFGSRRDEETKAVFASQSAARRGRVDKGVVCDGDHVLGRDCRLGQLGQNDALHTRTDAVEYPRKYQSSAFHCGRRLTMCDSVSKCDGSSSSVDMSFCFSVPSSSFFRRCIIVFQFAFNYIALRQQRESLFNAAS